MIKRLLVALAFLIALTSEPADAGIVAHNAVGPYTIDIDYDPAGGLSITGGEYTVPPAPPNATNVLVEAKVEIAGYTWIENSSTTISWASPHLWAPWSAGYQTGVRHLTGGYLGGAAWSTLWQTNTSQLGGMSYNSQTVGWPTTFDGTLDGLGSSGRWWQLRGQHFVPVQTAQVAPWRTISTDGRHHFRIDVRGTGGFMGLQPPGAYAKAVGHIKVHYVRVSYTTP